ncbi:KAP family P-loop NTPase fold protein [Clostridium perfringens]
MEEINLEELTFEKDDLLNRRQIAVNLTNIIKNKSNLNVLAIDSSWGTGKTTFINKWISMLKTDFNYNDTFETIYFNAWKNDYSNDALLSLICEINKSISKTLENNKTLFEKHNEKFKNIGKLAGTLAIKYLTRGALDLVEWNKSIEDGLSDFSSKIGESIFKQHSIQNDTRKALKKNLIEYQNIINKKIIIFIDELDRCKPSYAIQILETIKHLFNLNNYIFVISLDKEQLSHSIKTIYGENMDSQGYLRRFFDLEYLLPNSQLKTYIDFKLKELDTNLINLKYIKIFLTEIFTSEDYTLRDIEKAIPFIELLLLNVNYFTQNLEDINLTDYHLLVTSYLYSFIIDLKIKHPNLLKDLLNCNYENNSSGFSKFKKFGIKKTNLEYSYFSIDLTKVLDMFLKLNLLISKTSIENVISTQDNNYIIGKKIWNTQDYDWRYSVNLTVYFKDENILEKLYFTEKFSIS